MKSGISTTSVAPSNPGPSFPSLQLDSLHLAFLLASNISLNLEAPLLQQLPQLEDLVLLEHLERFQARGI
jgi:hypothetical protein